MKVTLENKDSKKVFDQFTESMATNLRKWHNVKPAKRTAFLLFCDEESEQWHMMLAGNPRAKYPTATAIKGLTDVMRDMPELYGWIRASVRYLEREEKKAAKALKKEDESHGKD